jgi:serine/threonine protein kinase
MKFVEDHPNAVALREVYQDERSYYLVMDYLSGGELFEHTTQKAGASLLHRAPPPRR